LSDYVYDFQKNSTLMNAAVLKLKEEAASLGANGVILSVIDERDSSSVGTGVGFGSTSGGINTSQTTNTMMVFGGDRYTRLRGLAIYTGPSL